MAHYFNLLIEKELISKIRDLDSTWGYANGFFKDDIVGITEIVDENVIQNTVSPLLKQHKYKDFNEKNVLIWIKTNDILLEAIENNKIDITFFKELIPPDLFNYIMAIRMNHQ